MKHDPIDSPDLALLIDRLGGAAALGASARIHKAFQRARKIKTAADLLRLLIVYALGGLSLRSTAAVAADAAIADLSNVALLKRFCNAASWLEALCGELLAQTAQTTLAQTTLAQTTLAQTTLPSAGPHSASLQSNGAPMADRLIIISDGSLITAPGGNAWRRHMNWDARRQRIAGARLTSTAQGERLDLLGVTPGALYVGDRNYAHAEALRRITQAGADVLVRITWNSLRLTHPNGRPLDWMALCEAASRGGLDIPVQLRKPRGAFAPVDMRLIMIPKPAEAAAKARRKARRDACKDQRRTLNGRTLACADHIMLLTSLSAQTLTAAQVGALYRLRWHIELTFKRLKSLMHMDRLPAKGADLASAWLHANLLIALIADDNIARCDDFPPLGHPPSANQRTPPIALAPLRPRRQGHHSRLHAPPAHPTPRKPSRSDRTTL